MGDWTTVPVRKATRDRLEGHPEKAGRDWDTFLRREVLGEEVDGDAETPPAFLRMLEATREELAQVPERTADELEGRFQ